MWGQFFLQLFEYRKNYSGLFINDNSQEKSNIKIFLMEPIIFVLAQMLFVFIFVL